MNRTPLMGSARALMAGLIDDAGLLPPASLDMRDAVTRYAEYRRGPYAWMLGRFILPCGRLAEFEEVAYTLLPTGAGAIPWLLSVLASDDIAADLVSIDMFNARHAAEIGGRGRTAVGVARAGSAPTQASAAVACKASTARGLACIDGLEVKADSAQEVRRVSELVLSSLRVWFELLSGPSLGDALKAVMRLGNSTKFRMGGTFIDAIPTTQAVAEFLLACLRAGAFCKMMDGLDHPIRVPHRLIYADDSPSVVTHGFVNVFLAAALVRNLVMHFRGDPEIMQTLVALLDESDVHAFEWHNEYVSWRDHRLDVHAIQTTRSWFARSFGSCSLDAPIESLKQIGLL